MLRLVLVLVLLVACSHNDPKPSEPATRAPEPLADPTSPVDRAPCEGVAAAIVHAAKGTVPAGTRDVVLRRCKDDNWSVDARRCVLTSAPDSCRPKFSDAQVDSYREALKVIGVTLDPGWGHEHPKPAAE